MANLHFACSLAQPGAFMHRLGRRFFFKFYQIILNHPTSVVMCADAERDGIVGLVSATLDAKSDFEAIRKGRFQLFWAALPALIRKPSLLWAVYIRNKSLSPKVLGEGFCVGSGARVAYWGWLPDYPSKGKSIQLMEEFLRLMEN
ncbi:MAG: hypothetical protein JW884_04190, partial [Deltaproteobacteria bacterium]|nr:hypothetical protein [Deltaproteobacteria bacterium]